MVVSGGHEAEILTKATAKGSHTSFYWAMRLLPVEKRNAMFAIYAFCRVVDDIADNPGDVRDKRARLQLWRQEIEDTFEGSPTGPIGQELALAHSRFSLQRDDFLAIIDGMDMDVGEEKGEDRVRIADLTELRLYCDRVAGAVGRLSNRVFGLEPEIGDRLAQSLGRALQLTNILRDLQEDAGRDRLYLPLDLLKSHGIDETEPAQVLQSPRLPPVCREIAVIAEKDFTDSEELLSRLNRSDVRPAVIMMEMYKRILRRLVQSGWSNPGKLVRLSPLTKFWIVVRYGVLGL